MCLSIENTWCSSSSSGGLLIGHNWTLLCACLYLFEVSRERKNLRLQVKFLDTTWDFPRTPEAAAALLQTHSHYSPKTRRPNHQSMALHQVVIKEQKENEIFKLQSLISDEKWNDERPKCGKISSSLFSLFQPHLPLRHHHHHHHRTENQRWSWTWSTLECLLGRLGRGDKGQKEEKSERDVDGGKFHVFEPPINYVTSVFHH